MRGWAIGLVVVAPLLGLTPGVAAQDEEKSGEPAVTWDAEGLAQLPAVLAKAQKAGKRVLVGLSGGDG